MVSVNKFILATSIAFCGLVLQGCPFLKDAKGARVGAAAEANGEAEEERKRLRIEKESLNFRVSMSDLAAWPHVTENDTDVSIQVSKDDTVGDAKFKILEQLNPGGWSLKSVGWKRITASQYGIEFVGYVIKDHDTLEKHSICDGAEVKIVKKKIEDFDDTFDCAAEAYAKYQASGGRYAKYQASGGRLQKRSKKALIAFGADMDWKSDNDHPNCMCCKQEFPKPWWFAWVRAEHTDQHHCRFCGDVICEACSESKLLDSNATLGDWRHGKGNGDAGKESRVCTSCYDKIPQASGETYNESRRTWKDTAFSFFCG